MINLLKLNHLTAAENKFLLLFTLQLIVKPTPQCSANYNLLSFIHLNSLKLSFFYSSEHALNQLLRVSSLFTPQSLYEINFPETRVLYQLLRVCLKLIPQNHLYWINSSEFISIYSSFIVILLNLTIENTKTML